MIRSTSEFIFLTSDPNSLNYRENTLYILGLLEYIHPETLLLTRYTDKLQNTSVDDYLVAGCNEIMAFLILNSMRQHFGFANVESKFSFNSFLYRFQAMWQHLRISAKETPGIIGQLFWALGIYLAANKPFSFQDSWAQSHLMILTRQRRKFKSKICDLAEKYWYNKKGNKTTSSIIADYLGPNCQDHPLIKAWEPYK